MLLAWRQAAGRERRQLAETSSSRLAPTAAFRPDTDRTADLRLGELNASTQS